MASPRSARSSLCVSGRRRERESHYQRHQVCAIRTPCERAQLIVPMLRVRCVEECLLAVMEGTPLARGYLKCGRHNCGDQSPCDDVDSSGAVTNLPAVWRALTQRSWITCTTSTRSCRTTFRPSAGALLQKALMPASAARAGAFLTCAHPPSFH